MKFAFAVLVTLGVIATVIHAQDTTIDDPVTGPTTTTVSTTVSTQSDQSTTPSSTTVDPSATTLAVTTPSGGSMPYATSLVFVTAAVSFVLSLL